jgi:hypothetical protein
MATVFTRAQVAGGGPAQAGMVSRDHVWTSQNGTGDLILREVRINWDALATLTGVTLAANDVVPLFDVAAGETLFMAGCQVITATTGACDYDVGLTGETNVAGFIDGVEANDAPPTVVAAPFGLHSGITFSAADTIDVKCLTASGAGGEARFWALILRVGLKD